jgi:hypothetical protein
VSAESGLPGRTVRRVRRPGMTDVAYVALTIVLFAVLAAALRGLERL